MHLAFLVTSLCFLHRVSRSASNAETGKCLRHAPHSTLVAQQLLHFACLPVLLFFLHVLKRAGSKAEVSRSWPQVTHAN